MKTSEQSTSAVCPLVGGLEYDPASRAAAQDPEPSMAPARDHSPVFYLAAHDAWRVTRYADIAKVLADPETFSSRAGNKYQPLASPMMAAAFPSGDTFIGTSVVNTDPPRHRAVRRFLNVTFRRPAIAAMEPGIRAACDALVDEFSDDGACDFVTSVASRLSAQVVGASPDIEEDLAAWASENFLFIEGVPRLPSDDKARVLARARRIDRWLREHIEECRQTSRDDLTSRMVHAVNSRNSSTIRTARRDRRRGRPTAASGDPASGADGSGVPSSML